MPITVNIDIEHIAVELVGTTVHVLHSPDTLVGHDHQWIAGFLAFLGNPDRRNKATFTTEVVADFFVGCHAQFIGFGHLHKLGLVDIEVATNQGQNVTLGRFIEERHVLGLLPQRQAMQLHPVFHGGPANSIQLFQRLQCFIEVLVLDLECGDVLMRCVAALLVDKVPAFADFTLRNEFMTIVTANIAIVSSYNVHFQPHLFEDGFVRVPHLLVDGLKLLFGAEAVGVFHDKFADAQQATAGT